jgi:glutamyl-tRNA synthetase
MAIINLLAQMGTSGSFQIHKNFADLENNFSFSKFSKSATNYDIAELTNINQKFLQIVDFSYIAAEGKVSEKISEKLWSALKANINFLHEIKEWVAICEEEFRFANKEEDKEFLRQASSLLPSNTADENCWNLWLTEIKQNSPRKGKELFMPIRLALSGKEHGPELKNLVNLISRNEIISRLSN